MYLLDIHVLSELRRQAGGRADPRVTAWSKTIALDDLYLSVVTIHEMELGIRRIERSDPAKAAVLRSWLTGFVLPTFGERVLPVDLGCALRSAQLQAAGSRNWQEALLAATALVHDLVLVTRNTVHFSDTEVPLLNPWEFNEPRVG